MKNNMLDKSKFDLNFKKNGSKSIFACSNVQLFLQSIINNNLLKGFYILSYYVLEGSGIQIRIDKSKFD